MNLWNMEMMRNGNVVRFVIFIFRSLCSHQLTLILVYITLQ